MRRPNILLITTDQQRWDALGANGNEAIHTPNLDQLTASGTTFDHCFVQHPLCMPSRVSMLSGQYPSTLAITHMGVPVPEDLLTLPHMLKPYGYVTANIGKLHFLPHANRDHRVPHPAYGFDHLEVSDEPGVYPDAYRAWARRKLIASGRDISQLNRLSIGLPPATHTWQQTMGLQNDIQHPTSDKRDDFAQIVPFPADDDLTHSAFVAEQTIDYLQQRANDLQPFLCIAAFYSPHAPLVVPQKYIDLYDRSVLPVPGFSPYLDTQRVDDPRFSDDHIRMVTHGYYAMVSEVDDHIGRILATLADLELAENTIVVFTSDHGEWLGHGMRYGKGYPGDDPVARVPLIIRAPSNAQKPGSKVTGIIESVDIVPTLLELAGIQKPPSVQGRSITSLLELPEDTVRNSALMEGTGWKALRTTRFRYVFHVDGRECLYDLLTDPDGYHDVAEDGHYGDALADCRKTLLTRLIANERPLDRTWPY